MCAEMVYLDPGELLIQLPAQVYSVYAPVASFNISGHFYSYDSSHLMEIGRDFNVQHNGGLTNQMHHHVLETLIQMVIGIPRMNSHCELDIVPLTALCLMVIDPERYKMKGHDIRNVQGLIYTQEIAGEILKGLGHSNLSSHPYYSSNQNYLEPGDCFLHKSCLSCWQVVR
ncbi:hypothetical protein JVT61DRAFT_9909 [Boletus reticuloceps]|uniref:Uncharacterized protein n=1 Tax=Boletus reticuloceps TaxID=495285 RepID=A0A8I2YFV7_9AGAM|nr:hypothetical protein JVT61DRAFT_9909 [Boletus reticuloceps]